jgi:hypothetical protein
MPLLSPTTPQAGYKHTVLSIGALVFFSKGLSHFFMSSLSVSIQALVTISMGALQATQVACTSDATADAAKVATEAAVAVAAQGCASIVALCSNKRKRNQVYKEVVTTGGVRVYARTRFSDSSVQKYWCYAELLLYNIAKTANRDALFPIWRSLHYATRLQTASLFQQNTMALFHFTPTLCDQYNQLEMPGQQPGGGFETLRCLSAVGDCTGGEPPVMLLWACFNIVFALGLVLNHHTSARVSNLLDLYIILPQCPAYRMFRSHQMASCMTLDARDTAGVDGITVAENGIIHLRLNKKLMQLRCIRGQQYLSDGVNGLQVPVVA